MRSKLNALSITIYTKCASHQSGLFADTCKHRHTFPNQGLKGSDERRTLPSEVQRWMKLIWFSYN